MINGVSPGQESVWDYPRPPRVELTHKKIRVIFNRKVIAETDRAYRVLETSHPPVYYISMKNVRMEYLTRTDETSGCEFKGISSYWTVTVGDRTSPRAAWSYDQPSDNYWQLKDHFAFFAGRVDLCEVDGEIVVPQPGDFYGGWITKDIAGPFKGGPGSWGW
jgi:uncharacterized protein (DUF427 family)